jgi:alkylation response protein AidB-like acyl-CoA dehydrogenase
MGLEPDDVDITNFRLRARRWLEANAERRTTSAVAELAEARHFQGRLHRAGLAGITWPVEYGGQGLAAGHQQAFNEEAADYNLASSAFPLRITLANIGPAILEYASEAQKRRFLPEMLGGEAIWVQLLSEPSAGSDLAALRMRAVNDGDEWVLSGEKIWTSFGQFADYGIALARTDWDAPKHSGLTMFAVPMTRRGLTVMPLREISGDSDFCQEFFDEVRLPADAVIGEVNRGWAVALSLFQHSRSMTSGSGDAGPVMDKARGGDPDPGRDLIDFVNRTGRGADPLVRQLVAEAVVDNIVSGLLTARISASGRPGLGNMGKAFGSVVLQRKAAIDLEIRGESAIGWRRDDHEDAAPMRNYMFARTATIAGGTHEIVLNTIGERVLGLPREPAVDKDVPFRETQEMGRG